MPATHNSVPAIDVLFHPSARTLAGECPLAPPTETQMDEAGIGNALVSQCKKWSCERQWMCVDTRLADVLRYTESSPRFVGLAGYNPFDIEESLREIELAVTAHGFRGVYLHASGFNLALTDPRMYPLFAKACELAVPVLMQLPVSLDLRPALDCLACDFPGLALALALPRPRRDDLAALAGEYENVSFVLDPGALAYLVEQCGAGAPARDQEGSTASAVEPNKDGWSASAVERGLPEVFQQRCMWGSNGMDWSDALRAAGSLPLSPDDRRRLLRHNAERVFALNQRPASRTPRSALAEILAAER